MFIKRFEASTLIGAVEQVRGELGSDAVILSTRTLKSKGFLPWLRRPIFEVIAAKDSGEDAIGPLAERPASRAGQQITASSRPASPQPRGPGLNVVVDGPPPIRASEALSLITAASDAEAAVVAAHAAAADSGIPLGPSLVVPPLTSTSPPDISSYLEPVMAEIEKLKVQVAQALRPQSVLQGASPPGGHSGPGGVPRFEGIARLEELLVSRGLREASISRLIARVVAESSGADLADAGRTYIRARDLLRVILAESREWGDSCGEGLRRMAFIGPTGVGKTTTIAKLAARYSLMQNKSVSLVAADTYRIAAVSQLKMYGELLGVEVDVVHGPQEMAAVVESRMNKDVVLIDTAGRSQRNGQSMESLEALLRAASPTEVHLVLSATTKSSDLTDVLARFGPLGYDKVLFTKLDESECFGEMVDVILESCIPVSFLTTGQSVPNDIEVSTADRVMSLLLPEISAVGE